MHEEVQKIYLFIFLSLYPKISAIASGATPIRSAGRAPDDIYSWVLKQNRWKNDQKVLLLPSGVTFFINLSNSNILYSETVKQGCDIWSSSCVIATKTRMPWFIMKVRPRDPSCVARYTHMDALYWYISVSTTRRKSWWTHWVPWEPLGFILCKS
jgi:hypothetical protein